MKNTRRAAAIAIAALISSACGHSENRYLKRQVLPREVVGRWVMTPEHVKPLDPRQNIIIIRGDGTCHLHSLNENAKSPFDSDCRWNLNHDKKQELILDLNGNAGRAHFFFDEENGRLLLWQYADDPDTWRYVEYQKTP
jgi:hypothetical protein